MVRDGPEHPSRGVIGQGREGNNPPGVATSGIDARADSVVGVVLGGHEDHGPGRSRFTAGEGVATGDAGGELAEECALAEAWIAIEDGDLAGREPARGEPAQWLRNELAQRDDWRERFAP